MNQGLANLEVASRTPCRPAGGAGGADAGCPAPGIRWRVAAWDTTGQNCRPRSPDVLLVVNRGGCAGFASRRRVPSRHRVSRPGGGG
jgi:hypothetical protein